MPVDQKANWLTICMLLACMVILAACGSGNNDRGIDSLGPLFVQAFNQGPNDAPLDITNANLMVQLGDEAFEL